MVEEEKVEKVEDVEGGGNCDFYLSLL